jgi:hypothetical protein
VTPQPERETLKEWGREDGVECVSCPDCAFTFDAFHRDDSDDEYSCPACAESRLEAQLAELQALLEQRERDHAEDLRLWGKRRGEGEKQLDTAERAAVQQMERAEEAEAEVARLRKQNERLREGFERIANECPHVEGHGICAPCMAYVRLLADEGIEPTRDEADVGGANEDISYPLADEESEEGNPAAELDRQLSTIQDEESEEE